MPGCYLSHAFQLWLAFLSIFVVYTSANILIYSSLDQHLVKEFTDMPAEFGPKISYAGIKGLIVRAVPRTACTAINMPPQNFTNPHGQWIVLIQRNECSFEEKVRNAQRAGYHAAIIQSNDTILERMSALNESGIVIPSVALSGADNITSFYLYNQQYFAIITNDLPWSTTYM